MPVTPPLQNVTTKLHTRPSVPEATLTLCENYWSRDLLGTSVLWSLPIYLWAKEINNVEETEHVLTQHSEN